MPTDPTLLDRASELSAAERFSLDAVIHVRRAEGGSAWSAKYQGRIRYASAIDCVAFTQNLLTHGLSELELGISTPIGAQRALMRNILCTEGLKSVEVSTARDARHEQRRVVLVDPVEAGSGSLNCEQGDRFLEAALSCAHSQVVFFLSPEDMANCQVAKLVALAIAIRERESSRGPMTPSMLWAELSPRGST